MSTTILTSLSTYMSKTSSMTTSKLKFVILKRLNKWKIKKKFRGGSCPGGKCTKVGGGRCHKNRGGRCHKNGGGKCPGGKCNTIHFCYPSVCNSIYSQLRSVDWNREVRHNIIFKWEVYNKYLACWVNASRPWMAWCELDRFEPATVTPLLPSKCSSAVYGWSLRIWGVPIIWKAEFQIFMYHISEHLKHAKKQNRFIPTFSW